MLKLAVCLWGVSYSLTKHNRWWTIFVWVGYNDIVLSSLIDMKSMLLLCLPSTTADSARSQFFVLTLVGTPATTFCVCVNGDKTMCLNFNFDIV